MSENETERHARALHEAEVRLWVEERELELLADNAPPPVRRDLEAEVQRLRALVDAKRAETRRDAVQDHRGPWSIIREMRGGRPAGGMFADAAGGQ